MKLNPTTLLLGFVAGVIAASGIFYLTSRHSREATPVAQVAPPPVQTVSAAEAAPPEPASATLPKSAALPKKAARKPVEVARATAPEPASVEPVPEEAAPPSVPDPVPAPAPEPQAAPAPPQPPAAAETKPPEPAKPNTVTISAGTLIDVRLGETLSSDKHQAGDTFFAALAEPLIVDGFVIAERGARAEGRIVEVLEAGRVKGTASLTIELTKVTTSDGQKIPVRTASFLRKGESSIGRDARNVGIAAAIGAAIGAAAGGGKGAAIGAAAGGAAGGGVVATTRGKAAVLPAETRISFRLDQPVTITEHGGLI